MRDDPYESRLRQKPLPAPSGCRDLSTGEASDLAYLIGLGVLSYTSTESARQYQNATLYDPLADDMADNCVGW